MPIKILKFLSIVSILFISTNSFADLFYKWYLDPDGQAMRTLDLNKPDFKKANFTTDVCKNKTGTCVKLFEGVQVQRMQQAIHIAKDYAKEHDKKDITCYEQYYGCEMLGCDDHIYCSSADNKTRYEFIFDDIKHHGDTGYKKGIAEAYCKMFINGKIEQSDFMQNDDDSVWCVPSFSVDKTSGCKKLDSALKPFGYYSLPYNTDITGCEIFFGSEINCRSLQNDLSGIVNNTQFAGLQISLDYGFIIWLGDYVSKQLGRPVKDFHCNLAPNTCYATGVNNKKDDFLTCYADGKRIDFWFDDLSESKSLWRKGSDAALKCIDANGSYDGRNCQGLDEKQCTDLREKQGVKTRWDTSLQACVLSDSSLVADLNRGGQIASTVGVAVGIAVLTVVTVESGGSTAPVLFAVVGAAATTVYEMTNDYEIEQLQKFKNQIIKCENIDCLSKNMQWFMETGSNYNRLDNNDIAYIDKVLSDKIRTIKMSQADKQRLADSFRNSFANKSDFEKCKSMTAETVACISETVALVADFLPVSGLAKSGMKTLFEKPKTLKNTMDALSEVIDKSTIVYDVATYSSLPIPAM